MLTVSSAGEECRSNGPSTGGGEKVLRAITAAQPKKNDASEPRKNNAAQPRKNSAAEPRKNNAAQPSWGRCLAIGPMHITAQSGEQMVRSTVQQDTITFMPQSSLAEL